MSRSLNMQKNDKVTLDHLKRLAFIYIRQSTMMQVRNNLESAIVQFNLVKKAEELGWSKENIIIIDEDQGRSGASIEGRPGFERLMTQIVLGLVGGVFCLEISRLCRANSDFLRLAEICALTNTLIIDEDGIYNHQIHNDRMLLTIKGLMAENELYTITQRFMSGRMSKAERGAYFTRLPVGFVLDPSGHVIKDPDPQVQSTVSLVFEKFNLLQSAHAVVTYFVKHNIPFTKRHHYGPKKGTVELVPLTTSRVLIMLHNPAYAGTYVYGRRTQDPSGKTKFLPMDEWRIVLHDVYPPYISWEQFLINRQRLKDNQTYSDQQRGAPRKGTALLQGIAICGSCGRRMQVQYPKTIQSVYTCGLAYQEYGDKFCQTIHGPSVDNAVVRLFLETLEPAQVELTLSLFDRLAESQRQMERQWEQRIKAARAESDRAEQSYRAVDTANRLVAEKLEKDWNDRMAVVRRLEGEYTYVRTQMLQEPSPEERQQMMDLVNHLPRIWTAETTTNTQRKQLIRYLIEDVTMKRSADGIHIDVRWVTNHLTTLIVPLPPRMAEKMDPAVIERIRELAVDHTDARIAQRLNEEGFRPRQREDFIARTVKHLRHAYDIPLQCPSLPDARVNQPRGDGRYSTTTLMKLVGVNAKTIHRWRSMGIIDGIQNRPHASWRFAVTPEKLQELQSLKRKQEKS